MKTKLNGFLTLLMLFVLQVSFAQTNISGVVTDQSGLPIPGVNVLVKGTQNGVQTDFDGKFTISANPGQILVFSFVGMKDKEVAASANMKVSLADDAVELEGVVVTALGIKREKKALGYSTTTLKNEQLTQVVNANVFESLSGKIAGVDITVPQQAGASAKIIVRGISSITSSNAPLYVVDGTPIDDSFNGDATINRSYDAGTGINDLDPNTIESVTFLKGAAATALYGSRAGDGAFIITTKKGKNQSKLNVDFSTSIESSEVARVTNMQNQFGQGWNGLGYSALASGLGPSNENGSWGPAFNGEIRPWGTVYNNSQQIKPYVALDNNLREFYDRGLMSMSTVTISGGTDFSDFSLSFSNLDSDGIIPTTADKYLKRSFAINGGIKGKKLQLRASLNYTNKDQNAVNTGQGDDAGEGSTLQQDLMQIPRDISIVDLMDYSNNPFNSPSYYFTPYAANPYWAINENATKITGNNVFGNMNLVYNITPELSATWQVGGNYRNEVIKSHGAIVRYEPGSAQDLAAANEVVGGVTEGRIQRGSFDTFFNLTWDKKLSESMRLNILGGVNFTQEQANLLFNRITVLDIPNFYELSNTATRPVIAQNDVLSRNLGVYAQAEFSFKERVFLTLSGRSDRTSTLPVDNSTYFYPSASISGIVLDNGKHFLKLRAGMASVANDTDPYLTNSSLTSAVAGANFGQIVAPLGGINYFELGGILGNDKLKPERTTETEVGLEGNLFNNRVSFDVSVYLSKTKDLIAQVPLDPSTGFTFQQQNIGDLENKGVELTLGLTPVKTKDFRWDLSYTFTKNMNKVVELAGDQKILIQSAYGVNFYAIEGEPIGVFQSLVAQTTADGQIIANPDTGYAEVTDDVQTIGNSQRDFVMGLQNTFKYKNLSLSFSMDWKQGGEMYSYTNRLINFTGNSIASTYNDRNPFIIPNSVVEDPSNPGQYIENTTPISFENITNYYGNTTNNPAIERNHVIDKTFVRLRELNLTYTFSDKITDKLGLTKLSLGVYGKNLFLWTPDENPYVDPEISTFGNDVASEFGEFGANPSQRAYGAILKLSF
ncbi:SusC/RagA family TonB-linked outer membrane protein [Flavobacterium longum]|uniref:SusC/RagA family TonB-linked outer membrane protein n=1 Tax=Flavobacterium longum TaxID=1299340 RepID=UPI0039E9EFB2